jgi:NTP pyrophosphatase (non-canonical NTP hydrolase)
MNINDYSNQAISTMTNDHTYGDFSPQLVAQLFGLVGESGEIAEKVKKIIRDKNGKINDDDRIELLKEIGDVLWYVNAVADMLGSSLEEVAQMNLDKVLSRKSRGVTKGSGDNR